MASVVGKQPTSPPLSRFSSDFFRTKGVCRGPRESGPGESRGNHLATNFASHHRVPVISLLRRWTGQSARNAASNGSWVVGRGLIHVRTSVQPMRRRRLRHCLSVHANCNLKRTARSMICAEYLMVIFAQNVILSSDDGRQSGSEGREWRGEVLGANLESESADGWGPAIAPGPIISREFCVPNNNSNTVV